MERPGFVIVRSSETGNTFEIAEHLVEGDKTLTVVPPQEAQAEEAVADYESRTVPELAAEVSRRNEGRPDGDSITPESGRKADLIAALVADDTK